MALSIKRLTLASIDSSAEIQEWLSQFPAERQAAAKSLLMHLNFISWNCYSNWILDSLQSLPVTGSCAIYAVRKLQEDQKCLWDGDGNVIDRPGVTQGSEDLVHSLVANAVRSHSERFHDHPSISLLREKRIHEYVLIDDSIGSGQRVAEYVRAMMINPTFKSWWSYGFVKVYILALARTTESESIIRDAFPGSDHGKRKHPKSSKISFINETLYSTQWLSSRWGRQYHVILDLCDAQTQIHWLYRRGWGNVMGNTIFHHSVPDNIPGILFSDDSDWRPLLPKERALPDWLRRLLDNPPVTSAQQEQPTPQVAPWTALPSELMALLALAKSGVRRISSVALRMDHDVGLVKDLIEKAKQSGLLLPNGRITRAGIDVLKTQTADGTSPSSDWSRSGYPLYVPKSWCTGRATVQPPVLGEETLWEQTEPAWDDPLAGGEVGQTSLERSDAKAATPPLAVNSQFPSGSRKGVDSHGPSDSKDT